MGRIQHFCKKGNIDWEGNIHTPFGYHCILLYYASQVNYAGGQLLFNASLSEDAYSDSYNLPEAELNWEDDPADYKPNELQPVLNFLNNELLPALTNAPEIPVISQMYGGESNFLNLFENPNTYLINFSLFEDDIDDYYTSALKKLAIEIRDFL